MRQPNLLPDALPVTHDSAVRDAQVLAVYNGFVDVRPIGGTTIFRNVQLTGTAAPSVGDRVQLQNVRGRRVALINSFATDDGSGGGVSNTVYLGSGAGTSGSGGSTTYSWADITDKPDTFPATPHFHPWTDITGKDHGTLGGLADDDHPHYFNAARHNTFAAHGATVVDHGQIGGLGDDDHTQYFNTTRHTLALHTSLGLVPSTRTVSAGTGLSGGGALSADVTLSVNLTYAFTWAGLHKFDGNISATGALSIGAGSGLTLNPTGDLTLDPAGDDVIVSTGTRLNSNFTTGWAGAGWQFSAGDLELDNLVVRKSLRVYELLVQQIRATNGSLLVASTGKVKSVSGSGPYTLTMEDNHGFLANDILLAQRTSGSRGTYTSILTVSSVTTTTVTGALSSGTAPLAGYEYVRVGNTSNASRRGMIYLTADDTTAPYIDILDGIGAVSDWTTSATRLTKVKARLGRVDGAFGVASGSPIYGVAIGDYAGGNYLLYDSTSFKTVAGSGVVTLDANGVLIAPSTTALNARAYKFSATGDPAHANAFGLFAMESAGARGLYLEADVTATDGSGRVWLQAIGQGVADLGEVKLNAVSGYGAYALRVTSSAGDKGVFVETGLNVGSATGAAYGTLRASGQLISTVATGTAPLAVSSTTAVTNLNADLLDGNHSSAFATSGHTHTYLPTVGGTVSGDVTLSGTADLTVGGTVGVKMTAAATLDVAGAIRAAGIMTPASGAGVEIIYDSASTPPRGTLTAIDRGGTNAFKELRVIGNPVMFTAPAAAPNDNNLLAIGSVFGSWMTYFDQTNHKLYFRVKYSDGTYKTGNIALV